MAKTPVKTTGKSSEVADFSDFGIEGYDDDVGRNELSIPFFNVLQANSPEVEDGKVEGAKAGMIMNTVTKELHDKINVLPVHKDYQFVEWIPRTKGGGFVGLHNPNSEVVTTAIKKNGGTTFGELKVGDNDLVETFYAYVLPYDPEKLTPLGFGVLSFAKTKIKPYKDWITSCRLIVPRVPRIIVRSVVGTEKQKNEKGTFFNFQIRPEGPSWGKSLCHRPDYDEVVAAASAFKKMIDDGLVRADYENQDVGGTTPDGEAPF